VKTRDKRACPVCGTLFLDNSVSCPVCLLRGALGNEQTVSQSVGPRRSEFRFEHYEVLSCDDGTPLELGRGAMGVTYKAIDVNLRYAVALKVINAELIGDESARRRFVREARAAASVRHPNVASVFHLGKSGDSYFYAMEFVEGESLDKVIRRSSRLDPSTALKVTALVTGGLEAIDKQKLVHRDIKPSNIMVSMHGDNIANAKIIDLGLAKGTVADDGSNAEISIQGTFAGTPAYASPEQFSGVGADIRSDLYSLGITLWEMLVGEVPFKGSTSRLIYQHQHATPPVDKLTHVPQPVIVLVEILLEKDPDRRLQTPTELLQAIPKVTEALESGRRVTTDQLRLGVDEMAARPKQLTRPFHPLLTGTSTRAFKWLLASVLGIAGLLLAWFFFSRHEGLFINQRVAQTAATEKSIAVLPFESLSSNKDDSYFADGVQGEILNNLAKIAQLKVISRTSVMQYRAETKRDLRQIANALGVANVLEGTVRREGNHVRVTTELVDANNDSTVWADTYDRDLTDIFAIQSEVSQTIARKLAATLSPEEKKLIEAKPTENLEAYDLFLRAKALTASVRVIMTEKPLREAINLLEQAIGLDPRFTLAYCASTQAQDLAYLRYEMTAERRASADAAINNALRLQPDLPEVHLAYAHHLYDAFRDYERARVQLAIAKRSLTNNSDVILLEAFMDRRQGNLEKAIQSCNELTKFDPGNSVAMSLLVENLAAMRQYRAADQAYDHLIALRPDQPALRIDKAYFITFRRTGENKTIYSAIAAFQPSAQDQTYVLSYQLMLALQDRNWQLAGELIGKMNGSEDYGIFGYGMRSLPVTCDSIMVARLQGQRPENDPSLVGARNQLNQIAQKSPADAGLLSKLALIDALLRNRQSAIEEAKRAAEIQPISKDAVDGPRIVINLAAVYAWSDQLDLSFETLTPLTKIAYGISYGELKRDPLWEPLRGDPRYEKLLAELAPKD
jgi:serine/threonine protein kinase/tetratricopeptide (TPR) repeat protein